LEVYDEPEVEREPDPTDPTDALPGEAAPGEAAPAVAVVSTNVPTASALGRWGGAFEP